MFWLSAAFDDSLPLGDFVVTLHPLWTTEHANRALAVRDFNRDGLVDIVLLDENAQGRIYKQGAQRILLHIPVIDDYKLSENMPW